MPRYPEPFRQRQREQFLNYESVKQWFDGLGSNSSEHTKEAYLNDLIQYCDWLGKTPDQLKEERKQELKSDDIDVKMTAEKTLNRYANSGVKPQNAMSRAVASIRSFYAHNFIELAEKAVKAPKQTKEKDYRCPTVDDLRKMLEGSNLRDRAILLTLFQSGLREGTLILLKLKHIREIFENKVPVHIGLRAKELKGEYSGLECHTFLGRDSIEAVKRYLDWRERVKGEKLTEESFLFTRIDALGQPVDEQALIRIVKTTSERAGTHFSPHDFRRAFQTNLEAAGVSANWVKKMTGHKLSGEENPYSIPKIEQLREAYIKAEPKLSVTVKAETDFDRVKREIESLREGLKLSNVDFQKQLQQVYPNLKPYDWFSPKPQREATPEEIKAYEEAIKEYDRQRLKNEILQELGLTKDKKEKRTMTNGNGRYESKIVVEKDLTGYLNDGWEFVASLNHEKYLVKRAFN